MPHAGDTIERYPPGSSRWLLVFPPDQKYQRIDDTEGIPFRIELTRPGSWRLEWASGHGEMVEVDAGARPAQQQANVRTPGQQAAQQTQGQRQQDSPPQPTREAAGPDVMRVEAG